MIKINYLLKKDYSKILILFLSTLLVLAGCAPTLTRNFGFSPNTYATGGGGELTSVSVQDFEIIFATTLKYKNDPQETSSILKTKLQEQLLVRNLNPVTEGNAAYNLSGELHLSEKDSVNGWIVPSIIVGIGLYPIGLIIMCAFPATDLDYKTMTNMNLLHTDSGRVVLTKTTENNENISANSWQLNIKKPDSKINSTFVRNTERAIYEIADEISKAIMSDKEVCSIISEK
jgi:hypothetical protein